MKKLAAMLLITLFLAWLAPADAQFFSRKPKTPPAQRVGELIVQVRSEPDERKRAAAAEELHQFDVKSFPEIVPVLVDVARTDSKPNVRYEAITSLAKIRPVSQAAGQTLEWAAAHDDAWKVRWQAKSSLMRYQWAGYHGGKEKNDPKAAQTAPMTGEPPLFDPRDPNGPRPAVNAGIVSRTAPKSAVPPIGASKATAPQPPLPVIVTEPQPKFAIEPAPKIQPAPTPPPLIIDIPGPAAKPAPKLQAPPVPMLTIEPAPKIVPPPAPATVVEPAPKLVAPTVPAAAPRSSATEPNFRPAGVSPPRQGFTTAVPQDTRIAPTPAPMPAPAAPTKTGDGGPVLTPPM